MKFKRPDIDSIRIYGPAGEYGEVETYQVGVNDVTEICATTKSGMYSDIPYVTVWMGETLVAEFCQHNIVGVYFNEEAPADG